MKGEEIEDGIAAEGSVGWSEKVERVERERTARSDGKKSYNDICSHK